MALKTFSVWAALNLRCSIDIKAKDLEDALQQARKLKEPDFVEILGEWNSGEINIEGIFKESK